METSETYNINISTYDDGRPEYFLAILKNFKIAIDGTFKTYPSAQINYLHTMLRGQLIKELYELAS